MPETRAHGQCNVIFLVHVAWSRGLMLMRLRNSLLARAGRHTRRPPAKADRPAVYRMLLEKYPRTIERNPVLGAVSD